jgi:hypothetical protein
MSRDEPDIPSIDTPLAHETRIQTHTARERANRPTIRDQAAPEREPTPLPRADPQLGERRDAPANPAALAILGPEPVGTSDAAQRWRQAVDAIENYRTTYDIPQDEPLLLGPAPAAGAFQQRLDRRHAADKVLDALEQIQAGFTRGRGAALERGPVELAHEPGYGHEL